MKASPFSTLSYFILKCHNLQCPEIFSGRYVAMILPTQDYFSASVEFRADNYRNKKKKNGITPKYSDLAP